MKKIFLVVVGIVLTGSLGACGNITGEASIPLELAAGEKLDIPAVTMQAETQNTASEIVVENRLIKVDSQFTDITAGATEFKVLFVTKGKIKQPVNTYEGKLLQTGDPCMIITAEFKNNTDYTPLGLISVTGLEANGTQKSWALDVGPLVGVANYDIPAQATTRINITANWADGLTLIRLNVHIQKQFYDLTFTPATPIKIMPYILVEKEPAKAYHLLALQGKLIIDVSGCLRIETADNSPVLIIWPYKYSINSENNNIWIVNDKGQAIMHVGEIVRLGGGYAGADIAENRIGYTLPKSCEGPYFLARPQ